VDGRVKSGHDEERVVGRTQCRWVLFDRVAGIHQITAMAIFAIIVQPNPNNTGLPGAIQQVFDNAFYTLEGGTGWLVSSARTAQEVSDLLGITDGRNGAALVVEVASYFGRANPSIWSWIKAKWESTSNA